MKLNENKITFGLTDTFNLGLLALCNKTVVKNLGILFDKAFKFYKQINAVVKSSFFHLRLLAKVKTFLSFKDLGKVIHAFIFSRLDYCNSLYIGVRQCCHVCR